MILVNPALWRDYFLRIGWFSSLLLGSVWCLCAQGVTGVVTDGLSRVPVPGAQVRLTTLAGTVAEAVTDQNGVYSLTTPYAGRVMVLVSANGFRLFIEEDIPLDGYATYRIDPVLESAGVELQGVTVTASTHRQLGNVRSVRPVDLVLIAGHYDDPVRVALSEPGLIAINDQANHFSARGQSPIMNKWYLEGLEIVNPNHTNNAGTLSDLPTTYGGGINLFSAQILGQTDIHTGVLPANLKSHGGAVINMHLHETARPEWRAKAGLLGFELGGGVVAGEQGVIDVNLRYSFTGLLANLGVDFGGEKIGYMDGVISYRHHGLRHKLKLFAWGGHSYNHFASPDDIGLRTRFKDFFDIDYKNDVYGAGLRYHVSLSRTLYSQSGFSGSYLIGTHHTRGQFQEFIDESVNTKSSVYTAFTDISWSPSNQWQSTLGLQLTYRNYHDLDIDNNTPLKNDRYTRPYFRTEWSPIHAIKLDAGAELQIDLKGRYTMPGYHAGVTWLTGDHGQLFIAWQSAPGEPAHQQYAPFRANIAEAGWQLKGKHMQWSFGAWYQWQTDLPDLIATDSIGRFIYHLADYPFSYLDNHSTFSQIEGEARQYGVEGKWKYIHPKGWRVSIHQAIYRSERKSADELSWNSGRYDGRTTTHILLSKETVRERNGKNRIWNIAARGMLLGGFWEVPVDAEKSEMYYSTYYKTPGEYNLRLPMYTRVDLGIARTIALEKMRWRFALDIQNVLGLENTAFHFYDPYLKEVIEQQQLGIIPVLSAQLSW